MRWQAEQLEKRGIFYVETLAKHGDLAPHLERLRKSLLDVSDPMGTEFIAKYLTGEVEWEQVVADDWSTDKMRDTLQEATRLSHGSFLESRWVNFYKKQLFDDLAENNVGLENMTRISDRNHFYYDAIVSETDEIWEVFSSPDTRENPFRAISCPKPDIAFFLPIFHTGREATVTNCVAFADKRWKRVGESYVAEPFTWSTLSELHFHAGLQPGPRRIYDTKTRKPDSARLKCYPWLIVELKRNDSTAVAASAGTQEEVVCCQANNAAACALRLQTQLAQFTTPLADQAHIQPIPTITTIGPKVTVWIAYYATDYMPDRTCSTVTHIQNEAYVMRAIWKGSMINAKDVVEFYMLLDNLYTWAMRVFKPTVALYLHQWKHMHSQPGGPTSASDLQARLQHFRTTVPMINAFWKEYNKMDFDDNLHRHPMTPVHFGLILQQMFMSDHDKLLEKIGRLVEEKVQNLPLRQCCGDKTQSAPDQRQETPVIPIRTKPTDNHEAASETSDGYHTVSDDDEVGSQTTAPSRVAPGPTGLRRSTRLNQPGVKNAAPVTPNFSPAPSSIFSSFGPATITPHSQHGIGSSVRSGMSSSDATMRTPSVFTASPTPSVRGPFSHLPSFGSTLDSAVKNGEKLKGSEKPTAGPNSSNIEASAISERDPRPYLVHFGKQADVSSSGSMAASAATSKTPSSSLFGGPPTSTNASQTPSSNLFGGPPTSTNASKKPSSNLFGGATASMNASKTQSSNILASAAASMNGWLGPSSNAVDGSPSSVNASKASSANVAKGATASSDSNNKQSTRSVFDYMKARPMARPESMTFGMVGNSTPTSSPESTQKQVSGDVSGPGGAKSPAATPPPADTKPSGAGDNVAPPV